MRKKLLRIKHSVLLIILISYSGLLFSQSPKNIIIVVGNGVGYNHLEANRLYKGTSLIVDDYDSHYGVSTYAGMSQSLNEPKNVEHFNTHYSSEKAWSNYTFLDSAFTDKYSAGTALATGKKTAFKSVGLDIDSTILETIIERANALGKKTGIVTNLPISDNSILGFASHTVDATIKEDITADLLLNSKLNLLFASGHPYYNENGINENPQFNYFSNQALWDDIVSNSTTLGNLGTVNDIDNNSTPDEWLFIDNKESFDTVGNTLPVKRLLGISRINNPLNGISDFATDLKTKTNAALRNLNNENGFVLVIESGKIDQLSRENNKTAVIDELVELDEIMSNIYNWIDENGGWNENLVIFSGNYESGMLLTENANLENTSIIDNISLINNGQAQVPGMNFYSNKITNSLVPMYAKGTGSEYFEAHANEVDIYRGKYLSNTEIAQVCFKLMPLQEIAKPKNIILMIGDGMGYNNVTAASYYMGGKRSYEYFPVQIAASTSNASGSYVSSEAWTNIEYFASRFTATCSAASGTALATGTKTKEDAIAVDVNDNVLENISMKANNMGYATGVVTSMPIVDATPAAFSSHNIKRDNRHDLINEVIIASHLSVIMGCGNPYYDDHGIEKYPYWNYIFSNTNWNELKANSTVFTEPTLSGHTTVQDIDGDAIPDAWTLIEELDDFVAIANGEITPKRLMGVPKVNNALQQKRQNTNNLADTLAAFTTPLIETVPDLSTMSKAALNVLNAKNTGFFLMIEGGAIDQCGHFDQAGRMIEEMVDFNNAIDSVIAWIELNGGWDDNLLIVTSDHETGYLVSSDFPDNASLIEANKYIIDNGAGNMPGMVYSMRHTKGHTPYDHTNQLIPFYAKGAGSEIFLPYADKTDYIRGKYTSNAEIGQALFEIIGAKSGNIINYVSTIVAEIPLLNATVGEEFYYELPMPIVIDPEDGTNLNYKISKGTEFSWLSFDASNFSFSGTPTNARGTSTLTINVTDKSETGIASQLNVPIRIRVYRPEETSEQREKVGIEIFPNPTSKYLSICINDIFENANLKITDNSGKLVVKEKISNNSTVLDLSNLNKATYSLTIEVDKNIYTEMIVVR